MKISKEKDYFAPVTIKLDSIEEVTTLKLAIEKMMEGKVCLEPFYNVCEEFLAQLKTV